MVSLPERIFTCINLTTPFPESFYYINLSAILGLHFIMLEFVHCGWSTSRPHTEGEHPVSAKFRGLRNRFVRWWVLGAPHEQPIFTPVFEKIDFFRCKSRFSCVSAAFQLRFSCVSAAFQLRFNSLEVFFYTSFFGLPKYPRSSKSNFWSDFFLCFSCVSVGKNGAHPLRTPSLDVNCELSIAQSKLVTNDHD